MAGALKTRGANTSPRLVNKFTPCIDMAPAGLAWAEPAGA